jgi:hypothetical protein
VNRLYYDRANTWSTLTRRSQIGVDLGLLITEPISSSAEYKPMFFIKNDWQYGHVPQTFLGLRLG